jgi:hypothetical protein
MPSAMIQNEKWGKIMKKRKLLVKGQVDGKIRRVFFHDYTFWL